MLLVEYLVDCNDERAGEGEDEPGDREGDGESSRDRIE